MMILDTDQISSYYTEMNISDNQNHKATFSGNHCVGTLGADWMFASSHAPVMVPFTRSATLGNDVYLDLRNDVMILRSIHTYNGSEKS